MTKKEVQQRVLQDGKPLPLDKFEWDEKTYTFSSIEDNLVIDFRTIDDCTFHTGYNCTFHTGSACTFNTGSHCTFDTGYGCTFKTGSNCTFKTGFGCTFKTGYDCTFDTGFDCTFDTEYGCTFKTGEHCVAVRWDIYGVIKIPANTEIKLNECGVQGYQIINQSVGKRVKIKLSNDQIVEGELIE